MLSPKELTVLLSVLNEEEKSLEAVSTQFQRAFSKQDHFKVGCCIYLLLKDNLLGKLTNRLAAYYILFDLYRTEPLASNPFLPLFVDTLQKEIELVEKNFIIQLISNPPKEFSKKSTRETQSTFDRNVQLPIPDLNSLKKLYLDRQPIKQPSLRTIGLSPLVFDQPEEPNIKPPPDSAPSKEDDLTEIIEDLDMYSFEPQFIRPAPPLLETEEDVIWLNPEEEYLPLWDNTMCLESDRGMEVRELMTKAFKGPLNPDQQKNLKEPS